MKNTILVVDDIEMNRDMLRMILESDYNVIEAENGKQALDIIRKEEDQLSAILLDLIMPELDGFGVMQEYPEYGLIQESIDTIVAASALHDVGKITIPDKILLKPGRLTKDEFEYMKSHTIRGDVIRMLILRRKHFV